jgi:hypothetical protein
MSIPLKLKDIHIDGGTQPRNEICQQTVDEYADAMADGDKFPAVVVFHDGARYWLADGFHRYHASRKLGFLDIEAEVHQGTKREAVLYSVGANAKHGLRRSNADKRKAVLTLLQDRVWKDWSDREIARRCAVSDRMVNRYREELTAKDSQIESTRKVRRGDQEYTVDTSNIGKTPTMEEIEEVADWDDVERFDNRNGNNIPDNVDPETGEVFEGGGNQKDTAIQSRGVGLRWAHKAINALRKIPANDGLRDDAFETVISWINHNR